jgi:hypothetical protein
MEPKLVGYFPKQRTSVPDGYDLPGAEEIASVSECMASGPEGWVDLWKHNDAFLYNSPEQAWAVVPIDDVANYHMHAYKFASRVYGRDHAEPIEIQVTPIEIPQSFVRLGYDVVSRDYSATFECSPLSCNAMAREVPVNEFCLFEDLASAVQFAERCAVEQPEPGSYLVVEVWRDSTVRVAGV